MYVQEHPIIDIGQSKWDKAKSDPKKGQYSFSEMKPIDYRGSKAARPPYHFSWERLTPHSTPPNAQIERARMLWQYDFVTPDDPYWPMGIAPNAEGHYILGDTVLMKTQLINYLKKRKREIDESERRPESQRRAFFDDAQSMGLGSEEVLKLKDVLGV